MIVYGGRDRPADPREMALRVQDGARAAWALEPGIDRHGAVAGLLVAAGQLAQGLADAEFEARGCDEVSRLHSASLAIVQALARAVDRSWKSGFAVLGRLEPSLGQALLTLRLPDRMVLRTPEGYAFYAVYPEAYAQAARRRVWREPPLVIDPADKTGEGQPSLHGATLTGADMPRSGLAWADLLARRASWSLGERTGAGCPA